MRFTSSCPIDSHDCRVRSDIGRNHSLLIQLLPDCVLLRLVHFGSAAAPELPDRFKGRQIVCYCGIEKAYSLGFFSCLVP